MFAPGTLEDRARDIGWLYSLGYTFVEVSQLDGLSAPRCHSILADHPEIYDEVKRWRNRPLEKLSLETIRITRLYAEGYTPNEISLMCGFSEEDVLTVLMTYPMLRGAAEERRQSLQ